MKICWMSLSMKRSRSCQRVTHQEMRWEKPQMPAKPSTDKILWSEESLQVHTKWMLFISSETSIFRTRSHWTRLTSCVLFDHHFEEYQSCIWSFKMVDNSLDLYSRSCMMRSKTTTTSNSGMTNGLGGASTCQKPTWSQSPTPRFLPIVNVPHRQLANQRRHRKRHQSWAA